MWGYQSEFCMGQRSHAASVFQRLDERFEPDVLLVGIPEEKNAGQSNACIEVEGDHWIAPETFVPVHDSTRSLLESYTESRSPHSHPLARQWAQERLWKYAMREAVAKAIVSCPSCPKNMWYTPSFPVKRDGYAVSVVLGLQKAVVESHPRLTLNQPDMHDYRSTMLAPSLIDATMFEYLNDATGELNKPDVTFHSGSSPADTVRAAGNHFATNIAYRADSDFEKNVNWTGLFDACSMIASLKYEQTVGQGRIIVARQDHPAVKPVISFDRPLEMRNARGARKFLQLVSRQFALHTNASYLFGLVELDQYDPSAEDLYEVNILDHNHWDIAHDGQTLMRVTSGEPSLPTSPFKQEQMRTRICELFPNAAEEDTELLVSLIDTAANEKHGTLLVIIENAAEEAKRLSTQATCIKPSRLSQTMLTSLTPIDGAVLLDPRGTCYAIGVILDGMASDKGNPARGARYNSAIRYVESINKAGKKCMAIVVSEDGGVDIVSSLSL